ncbi:MAG: hypothetical protein LBI28_13475 [Treponema sp.]|jgi:hypothetical protein|nr:hypothetical protein [Treponema sp.]
MQKYKIFLAVLLLAVITATGYTQVNRDELQDLPPVVFINYEGPHAVLNTREEIRQIGVAVGRQISEREGALAPTLAAMSAEQKREYSYKFEAGSANRYFIIHCVSGPDGNKMDADILGLGVDTGVDHIRNLRVIIQGYLQTAYNYNERDAAVLAEFITVYNAVYRGNWDYFTSRYKNQVISNLTRDKAGLSIRYDEWPGRTLIVIPLGQGTVDTSAITDSRVIEEMRKEDDQGVPQRQEMVNIIEREADRAESQAQTERQAIREEERQIAEERTQIAQERETASEDEQQALDEREQALDEREDALDQRREDAQNLQDFAEQRRDDAQQMRQDIAQDQQSAITQEASGVFGVTIERGENPYMGRIVRLNPSNGSITRRSPLDSVHTRTVTFVGGRLLAIAGENTGQGAVRLIEVNQDSLEMARQGNDDIMPGSLLWVNGNDLYAIVADRGDNNACYIGRFNTNLELQSKSSVKVHPQSSVTIQQGRLLTQRENGTALLLNPGDLSEVK